MATPISLSDLNLSTLKGKSALITGGASGLGLQTAKLLAESGVYVTVADVQASEPVIQSFKAQSLAVQYVHCDVTDWSQQVIAFKQAINFAPSRSLDIVCCFAGVDTQTHLINHVKQLEPSVNDEPQPPSTIELEVNLKGTLYTTDLAFHYFRMPNRSRKRAKVIPPVISPATSDSDSDSNKDKEKEAEVKPPDVAESPSPPPATKSLIIVSSIAGYVYDPHNSLYTMSKFGTRGLFVAVSREAKSQLNVRCNLLAPWAVQTPMLMPILDKFEQAGWLERDTSETEEKGKEVETPKDDTLTAVKDETTKDVTPEEPVDTMNKSTQDTVADVKEDNDQITAELPTDTPSDEPKPTTQSQTTESTEAELSPKQKEEKAQEIVDIEPPSPPPTTVKSPEPEQEIKYKGLSFAKGADVANVVAKCCIDLTISGRAIAIMPEGAFDLGDDVEGAYSGDMLRRLMTVRREAGDVFSG